MKHEKIINNAAASGATANWEALRDLSRVMRVFEHRKVTIDVADNGDIIVTNFCYPFRMVATFEGDGVAIISSVYNGVEMGRSLYDSHRGGDLIKQFEHESKDAYEYGASVLLGKLADSDKLDSSITEWAIKWSGFMLNCWSKKMETSDNIKVKLYSVKKVLEYSDIIKKITASISMF